MLVWKYKSKNLEPLIGSEYCTPAWEGNPCFDGTMTFVLTNNMGRLWSVDECYTRCANDVNCASFEIRKIILGVTDMCVTFSVGCKPIFFISGISQEYARSNHYMISDCVSSSPSTQISDQVAQVSDQVPQVSDQVAQISDQLPQISDQVAQVSNQVPQVSNQ